MRKLFLIFSFLVVFLLPVVSAEDYFVVVEGYTQEDLQNLISNTQWDIYTPQITSIEGNRIYFASEKDMVRFLMPAELIWEDGTLVPIVSKELIKPSGQYTLISGQADNRNGAGSHNEYYNIFNSELVGYYVLVDTVSSNGGYGNFYINDFCFPDGYFNNGVAPSMGRFRWQIVDGSPHATLANAVVVLKGVKIRPLWDGNNICYNLW